MPHTPDPLIASLSPRDLWVLTLWGEARGEPLLGQVAVAWSIKNRTLSKRWYGNKDLKKVLLKWAQYSCLWESLGGKNFPKVQRLARDIRDAVKPTKTLRQLYNIVDSIISGNLEDITLGATHYYANTIDAPNWTHPPAIFRGQFGHHLFYFNVA